MKWEHLETDNGLQKWLAFDPETGEAHVKFVEDVESSLKMAHHWREHLPERFAPETAVVATCPKPVYMQILAEHNISPFDPDSNNKVLAVIERDLNRLKLTNKRIL